ncbi:MAG: hypothetical protein MUC48_06795 [Leptolyngbya sp. Prado105]|jgi:hypothetical protein|nr:hypothetical protein [Leptolyngbya sp. Prado105]
MSFDITISYLRSLLLAVLLSFIAPTALIGMAIVLLLLIGSVPGFISFGQVCATQLLYFLETFGNGSAWEGTIVIGCACAVVGALFETYIFTSTTSGNKFEPK